jgi:glycolate oxidase iron-sulfur subunit
MTAVAFAGLDPCVHCGFCLPACPTYEATLDESDSPRGRIVLMRALQRGEAPSDDPSLTWHLDRCLGCRACESACPSGVSYGPAIEAARARIAEVRPNPPAVDAGLWLLARPARQRLAWWASRAARATGLPTALAKGAGGDAPVLVQMLAMLAATRPPGRRTGAPARRPSLPEIRRPHGPVSGSAPAPHDPGATAALFRGCVMDGLFGHVHQATIRALAVNGVATVEVRRQVCCGALAAHAGRGDLARELAGENVRAFEAAAPGATVVTNSAGCGAALKAYGEWLAGDPLEERARAFAARVRDVSEVLAERGPAPAGPLRLRVAYDAPCHLHHAQRVTTEPLRLLAAIPGLEVVPLEGADRCCGSAGLYSLLEPDLSRAVLEPKLRAIADTGVDVVATGNPGCLMQIGAGLLLAGMDVAVRHPVELLDLAYRS